MNGNVLLDRNKEHIMAKLRKLSWMTEAHVSIFHAI